MKRLRRSLMAALLCAGFSGAAGAADVVATIKPVHSLVAAVMAGVGEPHLVVRGGGSPHTYSLRPSDAAALQAADVVFWVGPGLEAFLGGSLEALASGAKVVALGAAPGIETLPMREGGGFEAHEHGDEEHHEAGHGGEEEHHEAHEGEEGHHEAHEGVNVHVWLDPLNAKAMVGAIAAALTEADPAHAGAYRANAEDMSARLDALVADIDAELSGVRGRPFVVFHDAYPYFERRFGVQAAGSVTVSPEVMPGARRLADIRDKLRGLDAACVFSEPQFEPRLIRVVTEGTGARTGVLDPLGADLADGPDLYETLIRQMARSLKSCLGGAD